MRTFTLRTGSLAWKEIWIIKKVFSSSNIACNFTDLAVKHLSVSIIVQKTVCNIK